MKQIQAQYLARCNDRCAGSNHPPSHFLPQLNISSLNFPLSPQLEGRQRLLQQHLGRCRCGGCSSRVFAPRIVASSRGLIGRRSIFKVHSAYSPHAMRSCGGGRYRQQDVRACTRRRLGVLSTSEFHFWQSSFIGASPWPLLIYFKEEIPAITPTERPKDRRRSDTR